MLWFLDIVADEKPYEIMKFTSETEAIEGFYDLVETWGLPEVAIESFEWTDIENFSFLIYSMDIDSLEYSIDDKGQWHLTTIEKTESEDIIHIWFSDKVKTS